MSRLLGHYIDPSGARAFEGRFLDPSPFVGGVARVSSAKDGRVGVIDTGGKLIIDHRFDFIPRFVGGVAAVNDGGRMINGAVKGGRWGYVAADGAVLVEPRYEVALDLDDGRLTVYEDGKAGFLDARGQVVVAPQYGYASWHHDGLAVVSVDGKDGYVDRDGAIVIAPQFDEASVFESGIAKVRVGDKWGVIDKQGKLVHDAVYDRLGQVRDGALWAVRGDDCLVLTAAGTILGGEPWDEVNQVAEDGLWPVRQGDEWGYLRPDGTVVALAYERALGFFGGVGRVMRDGRWGYVDRDGNLVIACAYTDAFGFVDGRAPVQTADGWQLVDLAGKPVGPGGLAEAGGFQDGRARVRQGDRWGYLDRDGGFAIAPAFDWCADFADGRAPVIVADRAGLAIAGPRPGVHVMPAGGLSHPVFERAGTNAHVIAVVGFGAELTPAQDQHVRKLVEAWERSVHPAGPLYTEDKWLGPTSAYLRVENLADPRADVSLLVGELFDAGLPIVETLYARWGWPPGQNAMQPNADPAMPHDRYEAVFDDVPSYWEAVWDDDPDGVLPATENYFYLKGAIQTRDGDLCLEERHMPMWFPDVKLCMGALQGQGEDYLAPTDASRRVEAAVRAAIARRFDLAWARAVPAPMVRTGDPGVEPIAYEGRTGYAFAFECGDLLHWFSASRLRWREPELMEAIREVVVELGLAPVILWQRFQRRIPMLPMGEPTVLVVNLWER